MDDLVGSLVLSLAGRDKDCVCVVIGVTDDGRALVVDGRVRKIESPKMKKLKHLKPIASTTRLSPDRFTNRFIREFISESTAERQS